MDFSLIEQDRFHHKCSEMIFIFLGTGSEMNLKIVFSPFLLKYRCYTAYAQADYNVSIGVPMGSEAMEVLSDLFPTITGMFRVHSRQQIQDRHVD